MPNPSSVLHSVNSTIRIIVVIPPFTNAPLQPHTDGFTSTTSSTSDSDPNLGYNSLSLTSLLQSLVSAKYGSFRPSLDLILTPHGSSHSYLDTIASIRIILPSAQAWPHGRLSIVNGTIGSPFERIVFAWTPDTDTAFGEADSVVLIDASRTSSLPPQWYQYLISARNRYALRPDVAAVSIKPVIPYSMGSVPIPANEQDPSVFLYAAAPYVGVLLPASNMVWRSFQRWLIAQRADWFLWPDISAMKNRTDPIWKGFSGNARADWTLWFSRFCSMHRLYTVFPTSDAPTPLPSLPLPSGTEGNENPGASGVVKYSYNAILRLGIDGQPATNEEYLSATSSHKSFSIDPDNIERIVQLGMKHGGSVSMTVINEAFIETAHSWLCNVDSAGIRPPGVVWITIDDEAYNNLKDIPHSYALQLLELQGGNAHAGTSYGSPGYWRLMVERTILIRDILERGIAVFAFETDQVWLRDPIPFVNRLARGGDEVDIVGTLDTRHEIGGNFLYLRPTLATRRLWRLVALKFNREYYAKRLQNRTKKTRRYIENDQSILSKLVLYDHSFRSRHPIVFRTLDTQLFVDGRWYSSKKALYYSSPQSKSPIMINNNFLIGIQRKKIRLMRHGHWFIRDGKCDSKQVQRAVSENEDRGKKAHLVTQPSDHDNGIPDHVGSLDATDGVEKNVKRPRKLEGTDIEAGLYAVVNAVQKEAD